VRVGDDPAMVNFTDSTCPTCRIAVFLGESSHALTAASHVHSEDEIIHVLSGELRFGRELISPGTSVAIPKNLRYGFRTEGPFRFLNYRRDVSNVTLAPGSEPFLETVESLSGVVSGDTGFPDPDVVLG
jgi:hypothetical protein